jgi:hypothetical protein
LREPEKPQKIPNLAFSFERGDGMISLMQF